MPFNSLNYFERFDEFKCLLNFHNRETAKSLVQIVLVDDTVT